MNKGSYSVLINKKVLKGLHRLPLSDPEKVKAGLHAGIMKKEQFE
jgi:hypothetical protein